MLTVLLFAVQNRTLASFSLLIMLIQTLVTI